MSERKRRIVLLATTTGYQTRSFGEAAERLDVELLFATDRCHVLDDPWRDSAIPIRFHAEEASAQAIVGAAKSQAVDGILAVGDRPTVIAAMAAAIMGLPGNRPEAAAASRNKVLTRERLRLAGLPVPWFTTVRLDGNLATLAGDIWYPCVLKPLALSGSRGVIRANDPAELSAAFHRVRTLLLSHEIRAQRDPANDTILIEGFIPGREYAVEGLLDDGHLRPLALFDKPEPLDGPFFEETIYVTPCAQPHVDRDQIIEAVSHAAAALGLTHGPVHAECRVNASGVFVLEVAARPIGGLCARSLRFTDRTGSLFSLEEVLLRHALGESVEHYARESLASGVMMIPIPEAGVYRRLTGEAEALQVSGVEEIHITAKPDQMLVPLPEGGSYLGFIFARADSPESVLHALRTAHAALSFVIDPPLVLAH